MKLLRVRVEAAETCGGLLDGLSVSLRGESTTYDEFGPLCLIGPNGAGKSQFLQVLAEIFQSLLHACVPSEERRECNPKVLFEIEYLIKPRSKRVPLRVRASRTLDARGHSDISILRSSGGGDWAECDLQDPGTRDLLPTKIVGYTSGDNETLSLPFLVSRGAYADDVARQALERRDRHRKIADTRLMLIDYGTHLEVLAANLLLGAAEERAALLEDADLGDLHSLRCVIQLAHRAAPKAPAAVRSRSKRKGIQLTDELESYIENLTRCATAWNYDASSETYVLDFWLNDQTRRAFSQYWTDAFSLYSAFHKLAMLNDLVIPRQTRDRFKRDTMQRRFASRLPEAQDEEKVFRFERVQFKQSGANAPMDYVSLSDGEHQLAQLLGTLCMLSFGGVLFLLDEPESHFNPQWRRKIVSRILQLPTRDGNRLGQERRAPALEQECLLTTHAPFVPSDLPRERVFIFKKDAGKVFVTRPDIETYGTTFDTILEECFRVVPPISKVSLDDIGHLKQSTDPTAIKAGLERLGPSVEKAFLADHLREVEKVGKN